MTNGPIHQDMDSNNTDIIDGTESVDLKGRVDDVEPPFRMKHNDNDGDENEKFNQSCYSRFIEKIEDKLHEIYSKYKSKISKGVRVTLLILFLVYFVYCMQYRFGDEGSIILLTITIFLMVKLGFKVLDRKGIKLGLPKDFHSFLATKTGKAWWKAFRILLYIASFVTLILYVGFFVLSKESQNIRSIFGLLGIVMISFIFSAKPSRVNWHPVFWSFVIQFAVAVFTLRTDFGYNAFKWLGDQIQGLFGFSGQGSIFVIGKDYQKLGMAFNFAGVIMFSNALVFLMSHWGVIDFIVLKLGWLLGFCLEIGPVESVVATANIFMGAAEAPLLVRPYLKSTTKSELHTIMACGFASISTGVMVLFIKLGAPASHLLTAAVISAPCGVGVSKLMYPETEKVSLESQKIVETTDKTTKKETNSLNAYSEGAVMGLMINGAIWSNMLAFVSMLALLNALVGWFGERAGVDGLTFELIFSYLLMPVSYLMGVDPDDCQVVGSLIGINLATPVVGYQRLGQFIENRHIFEDYMTSSPNNTWHYSGNDIILDASNVTLVRGIMSERSEVIAAYAMCGFATFTDIGITLAALISLCPSRKPDIINLVVRAFVAGNIAIFATGAVAGILFTPRDIMT